MKSGKAQLHNADDDELTGRHNKPTEKCIQRVSIFPYAVEIRASCFPHLILTQLGEFLSLI